MGAVLGVAVSLVAVSVLFDVRDDRTAWGMLQALSATLGGFAGAVGGVAWGGYAGWALFGRAGRRARSRGGLVGGLVGAFLGVALATFGAVVLVVRLWVLDEDNGLIVVALVEAVVGGFVGLFLGAWGGGYVGRALATRARH